MFGTDLAQICGEQLIWKTGNLPVLADMRRACRKKKQARRPFGCRSGQALLALTAGTAVFREIEETPHYQKCYLCPINNWVGIAKETSHDRQAARRATVARVEQEMQRMGMPFDKKRAKVIATWIVE
jgi:hypothetical protein